MEKIYTSPHWSNFRKIWWFVAIILILVLLALWLSGYTQPGSKGCPFTSDQKVETRLIPGSESINQKALTEKDARIQHLLEKIEMLEKNTTASEAPVDNFAPVISLNDGDVVQILSEGEEYIEPGASARDDSDGVLTVTVEGHVDSSTPGTYLIEYTVTDSAGNTTKATRTVIVKAASKLPVAKLYFNSDDADSPVAKNLPLSAIVEYLKAHPAAKASISGYHDPTGDLEYNLDLAKRRSITVSKMLQQRGIPQTQIVLEKPVQTTGTGTLAEARRVEVTIKPENN